MEGKNGKTSKMQKGTCAKKNRVESEQVNWGAQGVNWQWDLKVRQKFWLLFKKTKKVAFDSEQESEIFL